MISKVSASDLVVISMLLKTYRCCAAQGLTIWIRGVGLEIRFLVVDNKGPIRQLQPIAKKGPS